MSVYLVGVQFLEQMTNKEIHNKMLSARYKSRKKHCKASIHSSLKPELTAKRVTFHMFTSLFETLATCNIHIQHCNTI